MNVEKLLKHGYEMKDIGRESGYHTALHHIKMWAIHNDLINKPLFDEIERLKNSYTPIGEEKGETNAVTG
jgi:hypothetical protein